MRVLIAADSFKDALPAVEVCKAIAAGMRQRLPQADIVEFPLADGGEGTLQVLAQYLELSFIDVATVDPLFRSIHAAIGLTPDKKTAVIEMATVAGLQLLAPQERNPLLTTTFGVGQLLLLAHALGVSRILLAVGGSATNDAGMGMAAAIGWRFFDAAGQALRPIGSALSKIVRIEKPLSEKPFNLEVLCDVTNPLFGGSGAAHMYARQKGANDAAIALLDTGLKHFADCVQQQVLSISPDIPGAGAAGGLGFGAMAFCNASLRRGIDLIMELTQFENALSHADLVITGEGHLDEQSSHGKLISGICLRAKQYGVPVIAFCGKLSMSQQQTLAMGLADAVCINETGAPLERALMLTAEKLQHAAAHAPLSMASKQ